MLKRCEEKVEVLEHALLPAGWTPNWFFNFSKWLFTFARRWPKWLALKLEPPFFVFISSWKKFILNSTIKLTIGRRGPSFPFGHICKSNMPYIRVFYIERYIDSILLKYISWQCQELLRWYNNLFQQLLYPPNIEIYPSTIREQKLSESRTNVLDATLLIIRWRVTAFTASISYSIFRIFAWKWQF